jgi:uncharacterized protein
MKIVVAGGTGWLGAALTPALARSGHEVVILTRTPRPASCDARYVPWDGQTPGPWSDEVDGADAVINLVGESVAASRWTAARKKVLRASRIESTRVLAAAITRAEHRPAVLANASAVGYYGDRGDAILSEADPPGEDFLARLVVDWEAAAREVPVRATQLRIGVVVGPGSAAVDRMALPFRFFVGGPIGSGRQWLPWVHRDVVVGMFQYVLEHPGLEGPVNGTAPEPVRNREFAHTLGRMLHRPAWMPVPALALRVLFGELGEALLGSHRVLPERANAAGYPFTYPRLSPALADALRGPR